MMVTFLQLQILLINWNCQTKPSIFTASLNVIDLRVSRPESSAMTWSPVKEWSVTLTDNEVITGVAAGQSWVAVATDKYHLRLFTAGTMKKVPQLIICKYLNDQQGVCGSLQGLN